MSIYVASYYYGMGSGGTVSLIGQLQVKAASRHLLSLCMLQISWYSGFGNPGWSSLGCVNPTVVACCRACEKTLLIPDGKDLV